MTTPRAYRSTLREQQAARTKALIAEAARVRFLEKGWAGTTVRAVAEGAGVSEATVYHVYSSKAGLAISLVDAAEQAADVGRAVTELVEREGDPAGQLRTFVAFDRRLFESGGELFQVLAEGRRQHRELDAAWHEGRARGETQRRRVFGSWPDGTLREGVTLDRALAVYALLVAPESYSVATTERGWSPAEVEEWWFATLAGQLLAPLP